jgi:hypothetical protein
MIPQISESRALLVNEISSEIIGLFKQKEQLGKDQTIQKEEQKFSEIEKEVLDSLSPEKRERISKKRQWTK